MTPSSFPLNWRVWTIGLVLIAAAAIGVYWHGLNNALLFDDARLTDGTLERYGALWPWQQRLLSYGSFVWVQQWFGGEGYAAQRVVNLLLHLLTAVSVGLLTHALLSQWLREVAQSTTERSALDETLDKRIGLPKLQQRAAAAWVVAVGWFALNPMAVYATGYLVQRSGVMLALFTALACWAWVRCLQVRQSGALGLGWALLAAISALLAFLSKEYGALVPLLAVPLYIYVQRPPLARVAAVGALALLACTALAAVLWPRFGHLIGASAYDPATRAYVEELGRLNPGADTHVWALSIFNQMGLFFRYLALWLLPYVGWMSIDMRPPFPLSFTSPVHLTGALAFVLVLAASVWALLCRRDGWSLLGLCVVCVALLFGLKFATTWIQDPFVLYRSYVWAIFLPAGLALALTMLPRMAIYLAGCLLLALLAALSYERVSSLQTPYLAWGDAASKIDMSAPPQAFGRWRPFLNRGADSLERENAQPALDDFDRAVALGEPWGNAQYNRGMALQLLGRHPDAVKAFHEAEQQGMEGAFLYYQAAVSLRAMDAPQNALAAIEQGLGKHPDATTSEHLQLLRAEIYTALGEHALAARQYQLLTTAAPQSAKYQIGLGMAHMALGAHAQARQQFDKVLAEGHNHSAYFARALLGMQTGQLDAAHGDAEKALAMEPQNPMYQQLLQQLRQAKEAPAQPQQQLGPLRERARP